MAEQFIKRNERRIMIDTPTGPRAFAGMSRTWHEKTLSIITPEHTFRVGLQHVFLCEDGWRRASHLKVGHELLKKDRTVLPVTGIEELPGDYLYDLLDVDGGAAYVAGGVIHHNCEFLSADALLISSIRLQQLAPQPPVHEELGFKFWVAPEALGGYGKIYLVACDPATGSGNDWSVIQVFDFPALSQVAEFRTNDINIPLLYAKLKWIIKRLGESGERGRAEVFWTFERNGIGEALAALYQNDEAPPDSAELFSDSPGKLGIFTTGKNKVLACLQLKQLVEKVKDGMTVRSPHLLFELKNFVAKGGSYEAKAGASDDAVMATIGIVRLLQRLSDWNEDAFKKMNEYVAPVDPGDQFGDEPVPFSFG